MTGDFTLDPVRLAGVTLTEMQAVANSMEIVNPTVSITQWPIIASQVTRQDIERAASLERPKTWPVDPRNVPKPSICRTCETGIHYINCPTGGWWAHDVHPADDHDAETFEEGESDP